MKALFGLAVLAVGMSPVWAETFSHPCEQVYYDLHTKKEDSKFDLQYLLNCQNTFGESKTIKKAEAHKKALDDRLETIEKKLEQRIAIAKGEKPGKLVRTFSYEDMIGHEKNVFGDAIAHKVIEIDPDNDRHEYTFSDDKACRFFGYERATSSRVSSELFARSLKKYPNAPKSLLEYRKSGVFGLGKPEPKRYDFEQKRPYMYFSYFESLSCERNVVAGDEIEDFEIDIEQIRAQISAETDYPQADEDVLRILGIGRSAAEEVDDFEASYGESDDGDSWEAPAVEQDDFFIVVPQ